MATVIDTLTLQLGLDPRQFVEGRREAEHALAQSRQTLDRFGQNVEAQGKKVGDVFGVMKAGAIGVVGAFVGGSAASWIDGLMRMDNAVGNLSKTAGVGISNISMWQSLVKQVGGDASEATSALAGMRHAINNVLQGGGMLPDGAQSLLSKIGDVRKMKPDEIMQGLVDYFDKEISAKRMTTDQAATFLKRLPGMTDGMINLILKGRTAVDEMAAAWRKVGGATEQSAKDAAEYIKQEELLIAQLQVLGRMTFPTVTEGIKSISEAVRDLGGIISANGTSWEKWRDTLANLFSGHVVEGGFIDRLMKFSKEGKALTWDNLTDLFRPSVGAKALSDAVIPPAGGKTEPGKPGASREAPPSPTGPYLPGTQPVPYTAKPGAGQTTLLTDTLAQKIQGDVAGVNRFTAFNDPYHALLGGSHPAGRALDFTIKDPTKSADAAAQVRAILKDMGLEGTVLDEYKRKGSSNWTGGHIHVQVNSPTGPIKTLEAGRIRVQVDPPTPAAARALTGGRDRPSGAPAAAQMAPGNLTHNTNTRGDTTQSSEVNIGTINIQTKATDAEGIGRDIEGKIRPLALGTAFNFAQV